MSATDLTHWPAAPAVRPAAAEPAPPADPALRAALAADARHAGREAWLGVLAALLVLALLFQGWLWPLLALGFLAAPLVGTGLEWRDAWRARRG